MNPKFMVVLTEVIPSPFFIVDFFLIWFFFEALCHFASQNYEILRKQFGEVDSLRVGGFGENISTSCDGLHDSNVCIGDIFQIGEIMVQVTMPRTPCAKVDLYHQNKIKQFSLENGQKKLI